MNGPSGTTDSELAPAQAAFRFLVEIAGLVCWAVVGWEVGGDTWGWILAILFPVVAATTWASFRVPGDASAGQGAPIPVPGIVRLMIELDMLVLAGVFAIIVGQVILGAATLIAVLVHYSLTMRRVRWLLAQRTIT
ncbi:MAG: YrdB family protein [Ilumatobacter sp.]|nr:YrdB family protein [Ilumatobacter sp.]